MVRKLLTFVQVAVVIGVIAGQDSQPGLGSLIESSSPPTSNDDSTPSPRTPDPTFRSATGESVNPAIVSSTIVPGSSVPPSTDVPFVAKSKAPVLIPDASSNFPTANGVPATPAPITPEDITSPVPIAVTKTPTLVPVTSSTPDSVRTSPIIPVASFHLPLDGWATNPPTNVPSAGTDSTSNSGGNSASVLPAATSSAPQPTFHDAMSGATSSSGETTNNSSSVSSNGASSSSDGQESPTTTAAAASSSGSFSEASVGDTSINGSIKFGSSSTEILNEIGSDAGSQAIGPKANSGTRVVSGVNCSLPVVIMFAVFY